MLVNHSFALCGPHFLIQTGILEISYHTESPLAQASERDDLCAQSQSPQPAARLDEQPFLPPERVTVEAVCFS